METITNSEELRRALGSRNRSGIGFVPTMGALHAGHRSLVERARRECATVVVSVFVNPTQFDDKTDLKNYPRTPEADLRLLEEVGADYVFMPSVEEVYPEPDTRTFDFGMIDKVMEGATRPGHFNGVAQVVSRLFDLVKPAKAYFGEKDFQQIAVIREMVRQLRIPVEIIPCPIVRGEDGLALSSRNTLLDTDHRTAARIEGCSRKIPSDDTRPARSLGYGTGREQSAAESNLLSGRRCGDHAAGPHLGREPGNTRLHRRTSRRYSFNR